MKRYFEMLQAGDLPGAFAKMSQQYQKSTNLAAFEAFVRRHSLDVVTAAIWNDTAYTYEATLGYSKTTIRLSGRILTRTAEAQRATVEIVIAQGLEELHSIEFHASAS